MLRTDKNGRTDKQIDTQIADRHLNLKNSHQTMPFGLIEIEDGGREQMTHVIQEGKESE